MGRLVLLAALLVPGMAQAQLFGGGCTDTLHGAAPFGNPIADDRVYIHGFFDQLEGRLGNGSYLRWDGQGWIGNDDDKLWLKSEGRYDVDRKGTMNDGDHELLYDRPVSTYFDVQGGVRDDLEATLYASDGGHFALKTNASYDLLLTQRLILQPQFETNWYTKTDAGRRIGSGLSDIDMGLRLRYDSAASWLPISASLTSARSAARPATRARMAATPTTCASWPGCGSGSDRSRGGVAGLGMPGPLQLRAFGARRAGRRATAQHGRQRLALDWAYAVAASRPGRGPAGSGARAP